MFGVWAPVKTPETIVTRLNTEITHILKMPAFAARLEDQGVDRTRPGTPAEMAAYISVQLPKWAHLVKESGARAD